MSNCRRRLARPGDPFQMPLVSTSPELCKRVARALGDPDVPFARAAGRPPAELERCRCVAAESLAFPSWWKGVSESFLLRRLLRRPLVADAMRTAQAGGRLSARSSVASFSEAERIALVQAGFDLESDRFAELDVRAKLLGLRARSTCGACAHDSSNGALCCELLAAALDGDAERMREALGFCKLSDARRSFGREFPQTRRLAFVVAAELFAFGLRERAEAVLTEWDDATGKQPFERQSMARTGSARELPLSAIVPFERNRHSFFESLREREVQRAAWGDRSLAVDAVFDRFLVQDVWVGYRMVHVKICMCVWHLARLVGLPGELCARFEGDIPEAVMALVLHQLVGAGRDAGILMEAICLAFSDANIADALLVLGSGNIKGLTERFAALDFASQSGPEGRSDRKIVSKFMCAALRTGQLSKARIAWNMAANLRRSGDDRVWPLSSAMLNKLLPCTQAVDAAPWVAQVVSFMRSTNASLVDVVRSDAPFEASDAKFGEELLRLAGVAPLLGASTPLFISELKRARALLSVPGVETASIVRVAAFACFLRFNRLLADPGGAVEAALPADPFALLEACGGNDAICSYLFEHGSCPESRRCARVCAKGGACKGPELLAAEGLSATQLRVLVVLVSALEFGAVKAEDELGAELKPRGCVLRDVVQNAAQVCNRSAVLRNAAQDDLLKAVGALKRVFSDLWTPRGQSAPALGLVVRALDASELSF